MYLHIGQETVVRTDEVVGIFDMENTTISKTTRVFLSNAEKQNRVITVCDDLPRSFVVCRDKQGNETVYISQISCATLRKRAALIGQTDTMRGCFV
ncbi:MAG: DUF370 domain-containing protein [Clostridia bacterium]|nr:DUF370 domain-containing protein [Clostridia bacterium]